MTRRNMIGSIAGAAVVAAGTPYTKTFAGAGKGEGDQKLKGNIHHSVSQWCYDGIPLDDLAKACREMGI